MARVFVFEDVDRATLSHKSVLKGQGSSRAAEAPQTSGLRPLKEFGGTIFGTPCPAAAQPVEKKQYHGYLNETGMGSSRRPLSPCSGFAVIVLVALAAAFVVRLRTE